MDKKWLLNWKLWVKCNRVRSWEYWVSARKNNVMSPYKVTGRIVWWKPLKLCNEAKISSTSSYYIYVWSWRKGKKEGVVKDSVSLYTTGCPLFWSTSLYMKAFLPRQWDDQSTRKCSAVDFWNNFKITECQNRKVSKLTLKNCSLWVQVVIKPKDNSIVGPDFLSPGYFKVNPKTNTIKSQKAE